MTRVINFAAGPAQLPVKVLDEVQRDVLEWNSQSVGILEASHRSKEFKNLVLKAESNVRELLKVPSEYAVLFMPGGATLQFAGVLYNLLSSKGEGVVDYLVTGIWSRKAIEEAQGILQGTKYQVNCIEGVDVDSWGFSKEPKYLYYCDNETIEGVETPSADLIPKILESRGINCPIIADMSSNLFSRPVDVAKFGLIFASSQKNFGAAGITLIIVKRTLITPDPIYPIPTMMSYALFDKTESLYNTPPCFAIYVMGQVLNWIKSEFRDLDTVDSFSREKSSLIIRTLRKHPCYRICMPDGWHSRMNIPFRILRDGKACEEAETSFLADAQKSGMVGLEGHRQVGGIRVSLYNGISIEDVQTLVAFIESRQ